MGLFHSPLGDGYPNIVSPSYFTFDILLVILFSSVVPPWVSEVINIFPPSLCCSVVLTFLASGSVPRCECLSVVPILSGEIVLRLRCSLPVAISFHGLHCPWGFLPMTLASATHSWCGFVWAPHLVLLSDMLDLFIVPLSFSWRGSMLVFHVYVLHNSDRF